MGKPRPPKKMFSLSPVEFRTSGIAGRGVFAKRAFAPGEVVVAYAPKQRRLDASSPEASEASATKLSLLSEGRTVIVPDTSVPGGWLCNHSCAPNASLFADGEGRVVCTRPIAPGEEVTIFYGWVTRNEPERDPCLCGADECRGFINFDVTDEDAAHVEVRDGHLATFDRALARRLQEYAEFLQSIGQEHVQRTIATMLARMKVRT
jgi:SET domain-containing protein